MVVGAASLAKNTCTFNAYHRKFQNISLLTSLVLGRLLCSINAGCAPLVLVPCSFVDGSSLIQVPGLFDDGPLPTLVSWRLDGGPPPTLVLWMFVGGLCRLDDGFSPIQVPCMVGPLTRFPSPTPS